MTTEITASNQETTEEETLTFGGVTYTGQALEEFRLRNDALEALECWDRASWHYYDGRACEHYMIMALDFSDVPFKIFDYYEDYAWNTLTSSWKAMGAYIDQGKFSDDPELGEAKMREVWAWLDGWHKYHNASNASKG